MKIKTNWTKIARNAGGVFIGFRLHFPYFIWDGESFCGRQPTMIEFTEIHGSFGFLLWEWKFSVQYNHKPIKD